MTGILYSVTFDTSCVIEYIKKKSKWLYVDRLFTSAQQGLIDIAVTSRVKYELLDYGNRQKAQQDFSILQTLPVKQEPTIFRLDYSYLNIDHLADNDWIAVEKKVRDVLFPNQSPNLKDIDHLVAHIKAERDIFVAIDRHFTKKEDICWQELRILVMSPDDLCTLLDE